MATRKRGRRGSQPIGGIKKSRQGKLRKTAGAKRNQKVPISTLRSMKRSPNPTTRRRANFALNARYWSNRPRAGRTSGGTARRGRRS